jgi:hypothetical protein
VGDVYGYGESTNSTLNVLRYVQAKGVGLLAIDNIHHIGCDCMSCDFACLKGPPFWSIIVRGMKWLDMEGPCA